MTPSMEFLYDVRSENQLEFGGSVSSDTAFPCGVNENEMKRMYHATVYSWQCFEIIIVT